MPTACKAPSNYLTLCSHGKGQGAFIPNRSPRASLQAVSVGSVVALPLSMDIRVSVNIVLEPGGSFVYINTCQQLTVLIWECFAAAQEKALQLETLCSD